MWWELAAKSGAWENLRLKAHANIINRWTSVCVYCIRIAWFCSYCHWRSLKTSSLIYIHPYFASSFDSGVSWWPCHLGKGTVRQIVVRRTWKCKTCKMQDEITDRCWTGNRRTSGVASMKHDQDTASSFLPNDILYMVFQKKCWKFVV